LYELQQHHNTSDAAFNLKCKQNSNPVFGYPEGNLQPPSLHIAKGILGVESLKDYVVHVCINGCYAFDKIQPAHYEDHADEKCPDCKERRFVVEQTARGPELVPRQFMIYFGAANLIKSQLFTNTDFCEKRASVEGRAEFPNGHRPSPDGDRLRVHFDELRGDKPGPDFDGVDTSTYAMGFDCGQMFKSRTYSCGILGMR